MPSHRLRRLAATTVTALAVIGSASDAFAIRNRYTGQQNEGFGAYFFGAGGWPYAEDVPYEPAYRPSGYDRPVRPYRHRRPVYDDGY